MCGRYVLTSDEKQLARQFAAEVTARLVSRYNISPSRPVAVVRTMGHDPARRRIDLLHWGLIPQWAKEAATGARMINARAETLAKKPSFKTAFRYRRCLIPADGYYEWQSSDRSRKQPYLIRMADEQPFGLAGLYECRLDEAGNEIESCAVITTEPNEMTAEIHHRMPAIIDPDEYSQWLDPDMNDTDKLAPLLRPYPADRMIFHPVSKLVNNPDHDRPSCIEPV